MTPPRSRLADAFGEIIDEPCARPGRAQLCARFFRHPSPDAGQRSGCARKYCHVADVIDADAGECAIQYTELAMAAGPPARLSLALPLRRLPYPSTGGGTRWVRALLPEGRALEHAARQFDVPTDDRFALLSVLGRDVAGAVVVVTRPGEDPDRDPAGRYVPLRAEDVGRLVRNVHEMPLGLDRSRGVRLSLAGVQDKLLLFRASKGRSLHQPVGGAPSNLIVKPEPTETGELALRGLASNEAFCLTLAAACGLEAAAATVEHHGGLDCLMVRRFDRHGRGQDLVRTHQEDVLTALGMDPTLKYEAGNMHHHNDGGLASVTPIRAQGGPTLDQIASLLVKHLGLVGARFLLRVVTFNVAIGNADAHARNLSLLLHPDGTVTAAPLYDLVSTRAFDAPEGSRALTHDAAQRVNGESDIDEISTEDIVAHAQRWGIPEAAARRQTGQLLHAMREHLDKVGRRTVQRGADEAHVDHVHAVVAARLAALGA